MKEEEDWKEKESGATRCDSGGLYSTPLLCRLHAHVLLRKSIRPGDIRNRERIAQFTLETNHSSFRHE
jgi:hypothetical protein